MPIISQAADIAMLAAMSGGNPSALPIVFTFSMRVGMALWVQAGVVTVCYGFAFSLLSMVHAL
jgi:hypothetical protein